MAWSVDDIPDQRGRLALVTGASSGLGLETARALHRQGATVLLACRDRARAEAARTLMLGDPNGVGRVELLDLDLADLASVAAAAEGLAQQHGGLDLLINNAGVMALPRQLTRQGFESQFGINHLGHFALTLLLLPLLRLRKGSRVVTVTSGAQYFGRIGFDDLQAERGYDRWRAYGQSKLANVMTALELQRRLGAEGAPVASLAAHPGVARTNLQAASAAASGGWLEPLLGQLLAPLAQSAAAGALPQLYAATAPAARGGGHYAPDGLGGLRGRPTAAPPAAAALDVPLCGSLWHCSLELLRNAGLKDLSSPPPAPGTPGADGSPG
jgi:protochlorophyllide reductase